MKRILLVLISFTITYANAQLIFHEPFNYLPSPTNGLASQSSGAWIKINTQDSILISSGSLDYASLAVSSVNKVIFDGAGSDNYKSFSTQTSGTTYASFIINVSSLGGLDATGSYCANLIESNSISAFAACVWLKASATPGKFLIGISNRSSGSTPVYFTSDMNTNESYFIVISYSIVKVIEKKSGNPINLTNCSKLFELDSKGNFFVLESIQSYHNYQIFIQA